MVMYTVVARIMYDDWLVGLEDRKISREIIKFAYECISQDSVRNESLMYTIHTRVLTAINEHSFDWIQTDNQDNIAQIDTIMDELEYNSEYFDAVITDVIRESETVFQDDYITDSAEIERISSIAYPEDE
jgi:hypothetical protein